MTLRIATIEDIPGMHRVRLAVTENRLSDPSRISDADYAEHLNSLGRGWVMECEGVIVGFAIGRITDGNIWALFVAPQYEGRGYGTLLHDAMVTSMFEQGLAHLWLTTEAGTRAEQFYLSRNWFPSVACTKGELRLSLLRANHSMPAA